MKQITILLCLLLGLGLTQGCSHHDNATTPSTVRLVNATTAYASLDMLLTSPASAVATGVTSGTASSYATVNAGTNTFSLENTGSGTPSAQTTVVLSSGVAYTLVAYTSGQQLQIMPLVDNEAAPATGNGKIRVINLSPDAGSVNVYMGGTSADISTASLFGSAVTGTTNYFEVAGGNYQIWVTNAADKTDLRLNIPSVTISDQQIVTLILTSTTGGTLVNGVLVTQQGGVMSQPNTFARMRVAADITANGTIAVTANGVSLGSTLGSPVVSSYSLVPAGGLTMNVAVSGVPVAVTGLSAPAGADLTLLAAGSATSPQFFLLNDDNTRPLTGNAKIRLVNGVNGLGNPISLDADYYELVSGVTFGNVSPPVSINSGTISLLQVNPGNLFQMNNVYLQSTGVYSVFMLGDNVTPVGVLRRDR